MLITIEEFRSRIERNLNALLTGLQASTGRYGEEEAKAWSRSLPKLCRAFSAPSFQPLHLYFGNRGNLALEYQLPASSSWADVVLLGEHESQPAAVIIELKNWSTAGDKAGKAEGLIERQGRQELHPSDQVRGYSQYCRRFHSAINGDARVHGCVLFTDQPYVSEYLRPPNDRLTTDYPIFTIVPEDVDRRLPDYFRSRLTAPNEDFAKRFATGHYRQQRGFVAQIGEQILHPDQPLFELLDNQRRAFALCRAVVEETFLSRSTHQPKRRVVIVKGPPGSGKSAIAARLWASLVTDRRLPEGDVVITTTSQSQNSNWSCVFDQFEDEAGSGLVRKASIVTPISTQELGQLRRQHGDAFLADAAAWRENLQLLRNLGISFRDGAKDYQNMVTIVDEAHSLINPEHCAGRGQFGFAPTLGPQAYHLIRTSLLTLFLLDPEQGFRERENTRIEDIKQWALELGSDEPEIVDLEGAQFRCAGSAEYVSWLEAILDGEPVAENRVRASAWRQQLVLPNNVISLQQELDRQNLRYAAETQTPYGARPRANPTRGFEFHLCNDPDEMENQLRQKAAIGNSVRLVASYCRKWKTKDAAIPHDLPPALMDFHEPYGCDGEQKWFSRIWNYVPRGTDYTAFIRATEGARMAVDPLCEIGCPYAVRGFDFDYVGILWLDDLLWRDGRWIVNLKAVHEVGIMNLVNRAREENDPQGPNTRELTKRVTQSFRILLTRALKGAFLWVPDHQTREYIEQSLEFQDASA